VILRPYQQQAVEALWDYLAHREGNPALVLPTGAGKSPLMAAIAREAVEKWGGRVGVLAHVQELVEQNADKLRTLWPEAPAGIYAAGLKRRDRFDRILFMQVQSVAARAHQFGKFDLLLVDEAHRIPLKGEGMYRQFIAEARRFNPRLRVIGMTATPYRLQGVAVPVCGADHILTEVAYEARVGDLIRDGFLSPLTAKAGERPDLSGVHVRGGEYVEAELARAMTAPGLVERTIGDLLARAAGRRAGIVFCVNVAHAEAALAALRAAGETATLVHGGTPKAERVALIEAFKAGRTRWMVNVNVLSEGFDAPHIDCVAMLRPTKSPGLFYQQVGRGFRLAPGKTDCLVLDYAGNTLEHGPVDAITVRKPRKPGEAAKVETMPAKQCPKCDALVALGIRTCPDCGHEFAVAKPEHNDKPADAPILSGPVPTITLAVGAVEYAEHIGKSGVPTLRVTYRCGLRRINEYVCLEHGGFARDKAVQWWRRRDPRCTQVPRTVAEAIGNPGFLSALRAKDAGRLLARDLPRPISITLTQPRSGYPEIVAYEFAPDAARESADGRRAANVARDAGGDADEHAVRSVREVRPPDWLLRAVGGSRP